MKTCTFIGHRDTSEIVENSLEAVIRNLILNKSVTRFYVGTHGNFDITVQRLLKKLKKEYSFIEYKIVLAYIPQKADDYTDYSNTIYPDGLENVPYRFAIVERNKWMIDNSDYLICYVKHKFSNAYKFKEYAVKKDKIIFQL